MSYKCDHCQTTFMNKYTLDKHLTTAKYCLKLRGISELDFKCSDCDKKFARKHHLADHRKICSRRDINENSTAFISQLLDKERQLEEKNILINDLRQQIKELQGRLENIALKAVSRNFEDKTVIDIDDTLSESQFTVDESDSETDEVNNYKLTPLEVGQGYTIEHREEDGYINVTNLCKASGKQFKHWKSINKTKAFLQVLSSEVGIPTSDLIKLGTGSKYKDSQTWVHPQIAINIAQWISHQFDVKVSGWVYEIMMTGKVDITNTKTYKELQRENKDHKIKIQYLTKKYVKAQPRVQYEEKNIVYILTTKLMKKDRRYILGKATNLTSRLSTYNKSDEHEVVYYASCEDEETMSCVENMVFQYLNEYREQANRERFILPEKKEISFFSDVIKKSVEFLRNKLLTKIKFISNRKYFPEIRRRMRYF